MTNIDHTELPAPLSHSLFAETQKVLIFFATSPSASNVPQDVASAPETVTCAIIDPILTTLNVAGIFGGPLGRP